MVRRELYDVWTNIRTMRFPFKLPGGKEFDVLGFGENAVDYLIVVPQFPKFDTKTRYSDYQQLAGGQIASALVGLQRLGARTVYAGRFGADAEGDFGIRALKNETVAINFCEQIAGARSQTAFILIDEHSGERTVMWNQDQKLAFSESEAPLEAAKTANIFHTDARDLAACVQMAQTAKNAGALVSVDVDTIFDGLETLLPLVDILISSNDFPHKLTGIADEQTALQTVQNRFGCRLVGKTKGKQGGIVFCDNVFLAAAAYEVPGGCKDTTGAGDAFHAGFLFGLLHNESIEDALKIANAVAALKCRSLGARTALPNKNELQKLLNG